ncbi:MAG: ABC-F family ATP-binding cassette domain-containing protein [Bacteriovoracaceae bacterium]
MKPICTLKNLTLSHPHKVLFQSVNFTLNEGERIGVLGLNGHGKSSLFKVMAERVTPDTTVPPFIFDKSKDFSLFLVPQELPVIKDVTVENYLYEFHPEFKKYKARLNEIEKELLESDDYEKLIHEQTELYEKLSERGEDRVYNQYISYLKFFGITDHALTIENFSGGEQRKIALSLGLSAPQRIILWDEPTNHLDLETIEMFEDEVRQSNKTFLMISHDRSLLNNIVDRILHIQSGSLATFKGTYSDYLNHLVEEQERREKELDRLSNKHRRETAWIRRGVSARRTKSKKRIDDYQSLTSEIQSLKARAHKKVTLDIKSSKRKSKILVEAKDLGLSFGENSLFKDMNFKIAKGDKIALLGRNGVGKSSLIKLITEELAPSLGSVKTAQDLNIGFFSQKRESLKDDLTPWELIGEGTDFIFSNTGEKKHVAGYLEGFLFQSAELKRPISTFSGGEKNRLQLAKFMKDAKDIWVFDEPTNDLDLETIGILEEELKNYEGALVVIAHDRAFIENVADKCWVIHDEKLEQFDGGFSQARDYMEALELEEKLKELEQKNTGAQEKKTSSEKMTFQEKKRYEVIQSEIEACELKISELEAELETFDYSDQDSGEMKNLEKLQKDLSDQNQTLEQLFDEWEYLEGKKP